jgi:dihydrofolate reductase
MSNSVLYMSMSLDGFITGRDDGPGQGLGPAARSCTAGSATAAMTPGYRPSGPSAADLRRVHGRPAPWWSGGARSTSPAAGTAITTTVSDLRPDPGEPPEPPSDTRHYVTDGVESAMAQAKAAAGDRNVMVHGASLAQSLLRAGVLDEIEIHLMPFLLGDGRRLFDGERAALELTRVLDAPASRTCATGWRHERAQLILHMSVSLDGYVAHGDGNIDWLTRAARAPSTTATAATAPTSRCSARSG